LYNENGVYGKRVKISMSKEAGIEVGIAQWKR